MKNLTVLFTGCALAAGFCAPGIGQTTGTDLGDFTLELVFGLSGVSFVTPPSLPAAALTALANGTIEVHQRFTYSAAQRTLQQVSFVLPAHSPVPTASLNGIALNDTYTIQVEKVAVTMSPTSSAVLQGRAITNDLPTPFGNITGAVYTLAFGFQGTGPNTRFGPITDGPAGLYSIFSPSGVGSLSLQAPVTGNAPCSTATFKGTYMYTMSGSIQAGPTTSLPYAEVGRVFADGQGNATIVHSNNIGGNITSAAKFNATYVLDEFCGGFISWPSGGLDITVSKDGSQFNMVFNSPSSVVANGSGRLQ